MKKHILLSRTMLFLLAVIILIWNERLHAQSFGAWVTGITSDETSIYAGTVNDSGNVFGQYCALATGNCVWLLSMSTACKEGEAYPVLANSDTVATHLFVYCNAKMDNGSYRYIFSDFDSINNIVTKALRVGFAVPLQSDQIRVVRFDLSGSNRAITQMRSALASQMNSSSKTSGTRDQDL